MKRAGGIYDELENDSKTLKNQIEGHLSEVGNLQESAAAIYSRSKAFEQASVVDLVVKLQAAFEYLQANNSEDLSLRVDALAKQVEVIRQRIQRGQSSAHDGTSFVSSWQEIRSKVSWSDESLASVQLSNRRLDRGDLMGKFHELEESFALRSLELHALDERIGSGELKASCYAAVSRDRAVRLRLIVSYALMAVFIVVLLWIILMRISRLLAHKRIVKEEEAAREAEGGGAEPLLKLVRSKAEPSHLREFAAKRLAALPRREWQNHEAVEALIHELESEPSRTAQKLIGILNDVALNIKRQMAREI